MNFTARWCCLVGGLMGALLLSTGGTVAADMPDPPKVSTFAPAEDLVNQLQEYVSDLEESVESQEEYADSKDKVVKDADTVLLIALALGLHDRPNKYKSAAPALVAAAKKVSAATGYEAAKAAVLEVKAAMSAKADPSKLRWQNAESASLEALMKQVPLINTKMKRYLRGSRFKTKADDTAGHTAVLATIAQGSMPLADKTEKPGEAEKWYAFCAQMRQAASDLNQAIRAQDEEAASKGVKNLTQSCDDCHAVFHPEAEAETGKEE